MGDMYQEIGHSGSRLGKWGIALEKWSFRKVGVLDQECGHSGSRLWLFRIRKVGITNELTTS